MIFSLVLGKHLLATLFIPARRLRLANLYFVHSDPYFFLHHAQIDRVWWIWQNQNPSERTYALAGTITLNNNPPSRNTSLDDVLEMGVNAPEGIKIGDAMSTLDGPFCYIYV